MSSDGIDQMLRCAAADWLAYSGEQAGASLVVESGPNKPPVFVVVGTECAIRQVRPDDMAAALQTAWQAIDAAITAPASLPADLRVQLANAWQAARYQLDRLR